MSRNEDVPTTQQIEFILRATLGKDADLPNDPRKVEELVEAYISPVVAIPPKLNDEAVPTLEDMRKRVHKIGLISNTGRSPGKSLRQLLTKFDVIKYFDVTIFSNEIGCRKPDGRIFTAAAEELGVPTARVIHIGDDPKADVWGAKNAGMHAVLFDYDVPEDFKRQRDSMFALSRASEGIECSDIRPDGRISSLREVLGLVDSLRNSS